MKIYEYAVIYHPTEKDVEDNNAKDVLVVDVTRCLASSTDQANMMAARSIPEDYVDKLDQLEIACRPF